MSETFILAQISTAIKAGFEVKVLINDHPNALDNSIHQEFIEEYKLREKIIFENLRIPRNNVLRRIKALSLLILNLRYLNIIYHYFQQTKFQDLNNIFQFQFYKRFKETDIIHVQYGTNAKPIDLLKKIGLLKSKLVVSFHGHDLVFPLNGFIKKEGYYDTLFNVADYLVCNTPYLKSILLTLNPPSDKILIAPVAVNTDYFRPSKRTYSSRVNLITVGRLDELKGQIFGIEVVNILTKKGYDVKYHILGDGKSLGSLKSLCKKYNLNDKVVFHGVVNQSKVLSHLQKSDIFLMTSITNSRGMAESQGLVTAEAQACGLPVVAFDSGGVKYTLQDGISGFVVNEQDVSEMGAKVERLIINPELRREMGDSAIDFIHKNFSKNKLDSMWKEEYNKLILKS